MRVKTSSTRRRDAVSRAHLHRLPAVGVVLLVAAAAFACSSSSGEPAAPFHLEDHLAEASYTNPDLPDASPTVDSVNFGGDFRRALHLPTPGRLEFPVTLPPGARFDTDLGAMGQGAGQVAFSLSVIDEQGPTEVLTTTAGRAHGWQHEGVSLSQWEGRDVVLALESHAARTGVEALWATPTISGTPSASRAPNVILYIIDAAGAEYMSLYGYNRRTTPNLERLAREGTVFERAYSNSSWTKLSTPSFLSSLQSSTMGGYRSNRDELPEGAVPLAERLHDAGYQTALLTSNPFAGVITGLQRGVDLLRQNRTDPVSVSSSELHDHFYRWRADYPGAPYYVHFQTTDVHWPWSPPEPFAGLYTPHDLRERFYGWEEQLAAATGLAHPQWLHAWRYPPEAFAATGIDKTLFFEAARGLYDEAMAHNDATLGRFVESLKASGDWENTLLIVAADHGSAHGLGSFDPIPDRQGPLFNPYRTRIPLLMVWPGHIPAGRRIATPVSMIDVMPTVLDAVGLPQPEIRQGQSLLPLLTGDGTWEEHPVVLDEFYVDPSTGMESGWIEVVDGRWGASLYVEEDPNRPGREPPLLLYDLIDDPYTLHGLQGERPELVRDYTELLESLLAAHRALAQAVGPGGESELTEEQTEALRTLGYIQ